MRRGFGSGSLKSKGVRRAALGLMAVIGAGVAAVLFCEHQNSAEVAPPSHAEVRASFERASAWIQHNREAVLHENNPMLWLFVREAGRLAGDQQLMALASVYQEQSTRGNLARFFFDTAGQDQMRSQPLDLSGWTDSYQRLFAYGITCNAPLRFDPQVEAMLSPAACEAGHEWLRNPWCRTHQLMGLRFVQQNHCNPDEETARTIAVVQAGILSELRWDYRVEDAYLQRVWTLIESGRRAEVKAVWVRRILAAQEAGGGWTGADVILRLPGNRAVFWEGGPRPRVGPRPQPSFHSTAQGLYLMALLAD
jgi:hypothetical protein